MDRYIQVTRVRAREYAGVDEHTSMGPWKQGFDNLGVEYAGVDEHTSMGPWKQGFDNLGVRT